MTARSSDDSSLEERIGYSFSDPAILEAALSHASVLPRGVVRAGEQLEFLGDAVLDLAIADLLLNHFPAQPEGVLSKCRSRLVCTTALAGKSRELGIGEAIFLGRGEERSGGRGKDSILAAAYESVIGAIYRDAGFFRTRAIVRRHFRTEFASADILETRDWKTQLQELTQARLRVVPEYRVVGEEGPAHDRRFHCEVWVEGEQLATGTGASKREAEQDAASHALLARDIEAGD